ncbi:hypothetical protein JIG36_48865 [Actinoplanes sp. LDG1-06]|uniref:Uncharacterized protein n=1 Tax=Paractinoplanes ovalisporus TaxID=2810368 RepID=A0ABS2AUB0_9ACTN|nr:hypothetical protein [Actinoplanes ovalisporus]MBM2623435.1 hypothetical protein [Actinoplanes ovalisporus]
MSRDFRGDRWRRLLKEPVSRPAANLLRPVPTALATLDPVAAAADPEVIATAIVYARRASAEPEARLMWGRYAYTAAIHLWGPTHPVALRAASIYQRVVAEQGLTFDAVRVAEDRLSAYELLGDPCRELTGRCALAVALHRDGQCDLADEHITVALRAWWASPHGYGHGPTVLLSAAAIFAGCNQLNRAAQVLIDSAAHLGQFDGTDRRQAAGWLATITATHPGRCLHGSRAGRPSDDVEAYREFWLTVLHAAGAREGTATRSTQPTDRRTTSEVPE